MGHFSKNYASFFFPGLKDSIMYRRDRNVKLSMIRTSCVDRLFTNLAGSNKVIRLRLKTVLKLVVYVFYSKNERNTKDYIYAEAMEYI